MGGNLVMAMSKIKKDDLVIVLTGKDKGRTGKVLRWAKRDRVVVESINMIKKHEKPNPNKGIQGGIIEREAALHVSNIAIYNPRSKKADRVGFKFLDDGTKVRYYKSDDEMIDV